MAKKETKKEEVKKEEPAKRLRTLYAVDSDKLIQKIYEELEADKGDTFVLIKEYGSGAPLELLQSHSKVKIMTTFSIQFEQGEFDKVIVEKSMLDKVPERYLKEIKGA